MNFPHIYNMARLLTITFLFPRLLAVDQNAYLNIFCILSQFYNSMRFLSHHLFIFDSCSTFNNIRVPIPASLLAVHPSTIKYVRPKFLQFKFFTFSTYESAKRDETCLFLFRIETLPANIK